MSSNSHFNLNLRALCMDGRLKEALHILFTSYKFVKSSTYLQLLQACISKKALSEGKKIHSHINSRGFTFAENPVVQNTLINMYDKCGSLVGARKVFDGMTEPNVFSWNMIVTAYRKHGFPQEAFTLFRQMQPTAVKPDEFTFSIILSVCSEVASVKHGLQIHGKIPRCGFQSNVNVVNTLVCMYAKWGNIEKARELFDKMPNIDTVSWNSMITAYAQNAALDEALQLFQEMPQPDLISWNAIIAGYAQNGLVEKAPEMLKRMQYSNVKPNREIYVSIISGCAKMGALEQGMEIHKQIANNRVLPNVMVLNALINMYAKCGSMQEARDLFDNMLQRDVISWTSIIVGYTQNGLVGNALELFKEMQLANIKPNSTTFSSILTACAKSGALEWGMEIHQKIIESGFLSDVVIVNSLVDLYTKCGSIQKAFELFDKMPNADIVSRNAMITGYAQNGFPDEALRIFEEMPRRNVISWTAIIAGCAQNGFVEKALDIFKQMMSTGVKPNSATFASILPACTTIGTLEYGMEIHQKLIESQLLSNVVVSNALIDMYAICGSVQMAHELFDKMLQRTVASWNAIIAGYAQNGFAEKALEIFKQMQLAGVKPNSATFASILPACFTLGDLVNGVEIHQTIMENGFLSDVVVVTTLIDMYAKCGRIQKALELFNSMPQRDAASWTAIITGYAQSGLVEKALDTFKQMQLAGVKPDSSTYASIVPACAKLGVIDQGMEIHQKIIENDCFCDMVVTALIDMYAKTGSIGVRHVSCLSKCLNGM
ncbi:pentatricopeptide repeat-containing protein At2g13600 [Cryptomeria japonica]|uniref:pentatricopeptide repeat-containing protein At2g13600 n=1 Tax=Cryptomeria japonica TaxID=3369 RepID=UPI0027D9E609|nr:pentatricopeptide repeat-containing protein At2g13600 [Cryptomeria japonica]XP_059067245.1 pentatricopeptide repeat-containing protein At2g13600 [Cryptomeria japonica]XP_059067246.1 pentatricopeptide repeat-containing protein At2g13600 [Cryptomeria japonica]